MTSKNEVTYPFTLSVTDKIHVGHILVRQSDDNTQVFDVKLVDKGKVRSFDGLTPFFCLFPRGTTGQGLTEEIVQEFDGKKGTFKYTLSPNAWQFVGRNEAYFSFRKQLENGTWDEQYSTKMFTYQVEKSIYQIKFRDSNYWFTFKELKEQFGKWIDSSKNYWNNFLESVKNTIESIDGGGNVLEIAEFKFSKMLNKWFKTMKDRGDFWDDEIIKSWESPSKKYDSLSNRLNSEIGDISQYRPSEDLVTKIKNVSIQFGLNVLDYGLVGDRETDNDAAMASLLEKAHDMVNVFDGELPIVFPPGTYRFVNGFDITNPRITIRGSGFDTILIGDYNIVNMKVPREPIASSSTFIISDLMLIANNYSINSTDVATSVDIVIHRVWFGKAKRHINGSFITLNALGNVFELATEASIYSATKGGFRKIVISGNNFYANAKYAINIEGDVNYTNSHTINITGNVFDQANLDGDIDNSGMIRMSYCRDFVIKSNSFNGEGSTPGAGMVSLINCKNFEIDNEYATALGIAILVQNCHTFGMRGIVTKTEKAVHATSSSSFDINMIVSGSVDNAITVTDCDEFHISGRVNSNKSNGIVSEASRDGIIDASVTDCNQNNETTGAGVALKYAGGKATKRVFVQNNKISGNKKYNIRVETSCEDNVLTNISLGVDSTDTILDSGTRTTQKDIYSFTA